MNLRTLLIPIAALTLLACPTTPKTDAGVDAGEPDAGPELGGPAILGGLSCDPLVPTACGYPFPSDVYLVADATKPTGKKVAFGLATLPKYAGTYHMDPKYYEDRDGWSTGQAPMAHLPGATLTNCATQTTLETSVLDTSPTLIIEAATGARVPHFVELDMHGEDDTDRAFMLRTVVRLKDATRYIVVIRDVVDANGVKLEPTPVFKALRDGTDSSDPSVAPRRALYTDLFAKLATANISKANLQLAWDFTTASKTNTTSWMVSMRDQALAVVGADGPEYTITRVTENPNQYIRRRIEGTFRVPLYLDIPGPGAHLNLVNGVPAQNGFADFPFLVQIPNSVANDTVGAPIIQQGHGLLGDKTEGWNSYFAHLCEQKKYVSIAIDFVGMAEDDYQPIITWITGDVGQFHMSIDRQHQGMINSLLAMRMMKGRFGRDPQVQFGGHSAIDGTKAFYRGDSQGGIFGVTYMALSTDVQRGILGEPGMPYSLLLPRSRDFSDFLIVLKGSNPRALDLQLVISALQLMWDRTEPDGYAPYITPAAAADRLPNTPQHQVMIVDALSDFQVSPLGAQIIARSVGALNLKPVVRTVYGIAESDTPVDGGSGYFEFDYKLPTAPLTNVPPTGPMFPDSDDPHDKVRKTQAVFDATDTFFRTGVAQNFCTGACDGTMEPLASP
jgi:hypothetical protein